MSFIRKPLAALQEYCWPSTTSREEDISTETRHDQRGAQTPRKATGPLMNTVSTSPLRKLASSQMVEKVESHLSTNPRPTPDLESWSQASYGNPHDAVAIPVPGQRPMAKPNLGSSIRPRNTLNNVTKFANQNILGREGKNDRTLQTSNTRDNVPSSTRQHAQVVSKGNREDNHRDKRRKITQHPNTRAAENEIIAIDSDDDLNQSKLSSASSPVTTASQSSSRPTKSKCGQYQDMSIYNALGRAPEFRKVEKMLNSRPEYGKRQRRKSEGSRSRASNYSSTSSQTSTQGRPKVHNDSLQVENRSFNGTELVPVDRNMIFDSNHAEYDLLGPLERMLNSYGTSPSKSPYFNKDQTERQLDRKQILAVNQSENSKIAQKYVDLESQQLVEAPLRKRFIRADQPSERTTLQKAFDMIDTSEDELTMDIPKPLPSRYNESQSFTAKRSISPSKNTRTRQNSIDRSSHADIRPTTFVNSRAVSSRLLDAARSRKRFETKFKQPSWDIVSFYLPTKCLKQCDLTLVEDLDVGSFYIAQKDSLRSRMFDDGGEFNPEKLNIAEHCVTLSSKIRMTGSMSNMVKTEVCFEFSSPTTANNFLSRLSERTGDLLRFISKLPDYLDKVFARRFDESDDCESDLLRNRTTRLSEPNSVLGGSKFWLSTRSILDALGPSKPAVEKTSLRQRIGQMNHHTQQDEQIKYDHEEAPLRKHNTRLGNRSQRQRYCSSPVPEIPEIERYSVTHGLGDRWEQPVVYPASGRNRSTVNFDDLLRLDDGEFLNDNIVEFYIRYLVEQNPSTAPNVYFFSTFFYNSLNSNPKGKGGVNYASVKKWTAKDDIFSYDFVIVPVNEDAHWYMAMICNLTNLDRKFKSEDSLEDSCSTTGKTNHPTSIVEESKRDSSPQVIINTRDTTRDSPDLRNRYSQLSLTEVSLADTTNSVDEPQQSKPSEFEKSPDNVDLLDVDTIGRLRNTSVFEAGLNEDMEILGKSEALRSRDKSNVINKGTKRRPPGKRNDPNEPIILLLDSLGAPHAKTAKNLKEYVVLEGQDKRGMEIDTGQLPSMNAQHIPLQDNYCDCGLFLLGYVKKFLKDPREFVTKIIGRHTFSPEEWPDMNPKRMRGEIRDLLFKIEKQQSDQRKVDKQARRSAKKQKVAEQAGNMETGSATEEIQSPKRQSVNRDIELNTPVTGDPKALSGNSHPASPQKTTVLFQSEVVQPAQNSPIDLSTQTEADSIEVQDHTLERPANNDMLHEVDEEVIDETPPRSPVGEGQMRGLMGQLHFAAHWEPIESQTQALPSIRRKRTIENERLSSEESTMEVEMRRAKFRRQERPTRERSPVVIDVEDD